MRIVKDNAYYQFGNDILEAFYLDSKIFFVDVEEQRSYEVQIFTWMNELYLQGKESGEAIQNIHQKRWKILTNVGFYQNPEFFNMKEIYL